MRWDYTYELWDYLFEKCKDEPNRTISTRYKWVAKETGLPYARTIEHLQSLCKMGWIDLSEKDKFVAIKAKMATKRPRGRK